MEQRLATLMASVGTGLTPDHLKQLVQVSGVSREDLANYDAADFLHLCQRYYIQHPPAPQMNSTDGDGVTIPLQQALSAGLVELQKGIKSFSESLEVKNIQGRITPFDGYKGPDEFQRWFRELERQQAINNLDDSAIIKLASTTTTGSAANYISRILKQQPLLSWKEVGNLLRNRYSNCCSSIIARQKLSAIKQQPMESIQSLADRIIASSEDAFSPIERKNNIVIRELINVFIKALNNDHIARELIRKPPDSLDIALENAIKIQRNDYTFDITRGRATTDKTDYTDQKENAMEIDRINAASQALYNPSLRRIGQRWAYKYGKH